MMYTGTVVNFVIREIKVSKSEAQLMFNRQPIADHISNMKDEIRNIAKSYKRDILNLNLEVEIEKIAKQCRMDIPLLGAKKGSLAGKDVEYSVHFDGSNGAFFGYWPSNQPDADRPTAYVISNCLYMYYSHEVDIQDVKKQFDSDYSDLLAWFNLLKEECEKYNQSLEEYIKSELQEQVKAIQQEIDLETELNS